MPEEIDVELDNICKPIKCIHRKDSMHNPTFFSHHLLGIRPYWYQHLVAKAIMDGTKRIIICSSRQIGKTLEIAIIALWAAFLNTMPSGILKTTNVVVISKSDEQSKKVMNDIKNLMYMGDSHMCKQTNSTQENYFTDCIDTKAPNTMTYITFKNKCTIKSFPPTDSCRGETASLVLVDEGAYVDDAIFKESISPLVSATNGVIILSSTPRGQKGFYFDLFDPYDKYDGHEYLRLWFPWTICENKHQLEDIKKLKKHYYETGDIRSFEQEYSAKFTADAEAFFDPRKVDNGTDRDMKQEYSWKETPCCIGIDYGMTKCHTVLTVSTQLEDGTIRLLYQYSYPLGSDDNLIIPDVEELMTRFSITNIYGDACLEENTEITAIDEYGSYYPLKLKDCKNGMDILSYDFKNKGYCVKEITNVINVGKKDAYHLKLRNGNTIVASKDHEWFTKPVRTSRGKLQPVDVKNTGSLILKKGYNDKLVSVKKLPMALTSFKVSFELAYLLGIYIAEGHHVSYEKRFYISQYNKNIRAKIKKALDNLGYKYSKFEGYFAIHDCEDRSLFLDCGNNSYEKRIPSYVYCMGHEYLLKFVEGLIDGDGCYRPEHKDKRGYKVSTRTEYYTVNKDLANDVKNLFLMLGKPMYHRSRIKSGFGSTKRQYEPVYCEGSFFNKEYYPDTSLVGIRSITKGTKVNMIDIKVSGTESFVLWESGIITHNCPQGYRTNNELKNKGYPFHEFNFRSNQATIDSNKMVNRNLGYFGFRGKLFQGKIKFPEIKELIVEMKALMEVDNNIHVSIRKPEGGFDDRIDSFLLSTVPWLKDDNANMHFETVDYDNPFQPIKKGKRNFREDHELEQMRLRANEFKVWSKPIGQTI